MHAREASECLTVRPYQLLCTICSLDDEGAAGEGVRRILAAVRQCADMPVTLACNAGGVYAYQDPGTADDTPESDEFNRKRDLDILQRMSWPPGITLPARTALCLLRERITTVAGICGYDEVTSAAWQGCPRAASGSYERGRERGLGTIIAPRREADMEREKCLSLQAMYSGRPVTIRPHILLCAVCQYGGGTRPPFKPDNLPELLQMILQSKPDTPITMARGADWMMCAPCPSRVPELNACVNVLGSGGLSNEKRDLDTLQRLGLQYGSTMAARDLFRLILDRIPDTREICQRPGNPSPSVWWDGCGEANLTAGNPGYEKGRNELKEWLG